ncbi:hypothetical protein ScPMuIL_014555 [Solemya velum]
MGRKSVKAKERKQKRKEENAKLAASSVKVEAANKIEDPLSMLEPFKKYERRGLSVLISCVKAGDMDKDTVDWVFDLTKKNMQTLQVFKLICNVLGYETSDWGWKDRDKRDEMTEDKAIYLLVRDTSDKLVAFVHFRFDLECDDEVVYCYEIQLIEEVRQKGLGKFLMQILELLAHKTEMKKVMLTVFKHNTEGYDFFTKTMKYEVDEISPEDPVFDESFSYVILSKKIQPRKTQQT